MSHSFPQDVSSARWFEAAALQSPEKAWLFYDKMTENQNLLADPVGADHLFRHTLSELGLDLAKAEKDAASQGVQSEIDADTHEAADLGLPHVYPTFLLNGVVIQGGTSPAYFDMVIDRLTSKSPGFR